MAFEFQWEPAADEAYKKLEAAANEAFENRRQSGRKKSSKQEGLFKQIVKALRFLREDPRHPGLCCHIYHGLEHPYDPSEKVWEAYAQNKTPSAFRVFWCYGPGKGLITIVAITPHP